MSRSQLPLNALRAFEAAARHASFTHAAEELHVTQAAVSHQVKSLEQRLGVQLFRRDARRAELTQAGHTYFPPVRDAFDMVEAQTRALKPSASSASASSAATVALPVSCQVSAKALPSWAFEVCAPAQNGTAISANSRWLRREIILPEKAILGVSKLRVWCHQSRG